MYHKVEIDFHGRPLSIETGRLAKQASGAVLVQYGETVVLVTAVATSTARVGIDFFPLTVDYVEKTFAAGKIPGGFFKREGRPAEKEVLTSRLIDRPIRPLFPDGFLCETQIIATVLSVDKVNDADMLALIGASAALHVSDIPFHGPIAGVRIARRDGKFIINPPQTDTSGSDLSIVVAGSRDSIVMVEGGASIVPEDIVLDALYTAHAEMQPLIEMQEDLRKAVGKTKREVVAPEVDAALQSRVQELATPKIREALQFAGKQERATAMKQAQTDVMAVVRETFPEQEAEGKSAYESVKKHVFRELIAKEKRRLDGRSLSDVRPISCEVQVLPRTHGSAVFTRGETQALAVTTLGTSSDEQKIDALIGEHYKKFMLHYNFPPFSVGEVKFLRNPGRREVGHGALAERALTAILPAEADFPYTIRLVSEVLESNGSSSMATVCGGTLSMMDAGVPIKAPVAGIAMGLIKEGENISILSDILGDEDHLGDMDFKVAGTTQGITAIQLDNKLGSLPAELLQRALAQAKEGRLHILGQMAEALAVPRPQLAPNAPRIRSLVIGTHRIRTLIGAGGKTIRELQADTGTSIDVADDGTVRIFAPDVDALRAAEKRVIELTGEPEVGRYYRGPVTGVANFGAFVRLFEGIEGMIHVSELSDQRVGSVDSVVSEGQIVTVKVLGTDRGRIQLSLKEAQGVDESDIANL
jgi:polyribonucleotide nucleotidyltransferase